MMVDELNARFGIAGRLHFAAGPGGMPHLFMAAAGAAAELALQGGQLLRYGQANDPSLLWVSRQAVFAPGRAVRGGIPVCWPWFGPHPSDQGKPQHGFVRTALWEVLATGTAGKAVWARLGLNDSPATRALWPHAFALELLATVGEQLDLALMARNTDAAPWSCGGALHSYFAVGDVTAIAIGGLEDTHYIDKVAGGAAGVQAGAVQISGETDRVYLDTTAICTISDPVQQRRISVAKAGSQTTVVWNPWIEKARQLADFGDDEYRDMVCVETANAANDQIVVAPSETHTLRTIISSARL